MRARIQRSRPEPEPNPTGLCNRLNDLEDRGLKLRGTALRLASDMADLALDIQSLNEDIKKVGI